MLELVASLSHKPALTQKKGLDIGWLQTTEEVHLLVPTESEVNKSDLSFQVHPQRLHLAVKGESLLSGDLPESVDIDGMHAVSFIPSIDLVMSADILLPKVQTHGTTMQPAQHEVFSYHQDNYIYLNKCTGGVTLE